MSILTSRLTIAVALAVSIAGGAALGILGARIAVEQRSAHAAIVQNGWISTFIPDHFGTDYLLRAAVAQTMLATSPASDNVTYIATHDSDQRALDGHSRYVLHFARNDLPPTGAFWSLSIIGADDLLFAASPVGRYAIGSNTPGLTPDTGGSYDLFIQPDEPEEGSANWLPCPPKGFRLVLRVYEPGTKILKRQWQPPVVRRQERLA